MRRTTQVQIEDRGETKTFEIKEMPCLQAERWCIRACKLLIGTGVLSTLDIDAIQSSADLPQIAAKILQASGGFAALADINQAEFDELHDQMLQTVSIITPGGAKLKLTPTTIEGNIEDYKTLLKLLVEAVKLNLNFSLDGPQTTATPAVAAQTSSHAKPGISVR